MQVRRASLVLVVFGLITLLVIGAVNLASQDEDKPASAPPAEQTEQTNDEDSTADNLKVENEPTAENEQPSDSAATGDLPRTGAEDFIAPVAISGLVLSGVTYHRSCQTVRRALLN